MGDAGRQCQPLHKPLVTPCQRHADVRRHKCGEVAIACLPVTGADSAGVIRRVQMFANGFNTGEIGIRQKPCRVSEQFGKVWCGLVT
jgi:hypothetical protein